MTSPKAFLRLPAQRLVESAKEPDAADKISSTRGIWGLCLPAERRFLAGFPVGPTLGCALLGGRVSETECPLPAQLEEDGGERC